MLNALDHSVLICPDIEPAISDYTVLMGRGPDWRAVDTEMGTATALFQTGNTALELLAPQGRGPVAQKLRDMLARNGSPLTSLAFATPDIEGAHHVCTRRGLAPSKISAGQSIDIDSGQKRTWQRFRCGDQNCAGIKTFILDTQASRPQPVSAAPGHIQTLDHIVINTSHPERAIAHYGARLGLRLALDRTIESFKTRFMFFRVGQLTLEVIHRLETQTDITQNDSIWGLTWAVHDLGAAHDRLTQAGRNISEIRTGRKPGSQVFTVKDGTQGVPTLFIAHTPHTTP